MSQSINNHFPTAAPLAVDLTPLAVPSVAPAAPPVAQQLSATQFPDGSWADAQVELSAAASDDPTVAMFQMQMEADNFMFQQQMAMMQQRAAASARSAQVKTISVSDTKPVTGPDVRGVDYSGGDEGGDSDE